MIFTYILVVVPCVQDVTLLVRVQSHCRRSLKGEESKVETRINGKLKGKVRRESRIEQTSEATAPFLSNRASAFTTRFTTPPAACTYGGCDGCVRIVHATVFLRYRDPSLSSLSFVFLDFSTTSMHSFLRPTLQDRKLVNNQELGCQIKIAVPFYR